MQINKIEHEKKAVAKKQKLKRNNYMNIKCIITISNKFEIQMQLIKSFKNMYNIKNIKEQIKLSHVCFLEQHK